MRFTGALKTRTDDRGFGFFVPVQGGQDLFVEIKDSPPGTGRPSVGQTLTFEVETRADGKKQARAVQYPIGARPR
jgi:cold shock CspA family protein